MLISFVLQRRKLDNVVRIKLNRSSPLPAAQYTTVVDSQVQIPISSAFRYDESVSNKSDITVCDVFTSERDVCFDKLMRKAYGITLVQSVNSQQESEWYLRWKQLIQHFGNHYLNQKYPGCKKGAAKN